MNAFDCARQIVRSLRAAGHTALLAGGCVRDRLLGLEPEDYDVATSATPEAVAALFPRTCPVGVRFGVVIVLLDDAVVEVATFRTDGDYRDGRRPESVRFGTPEEDAQRRDFTINALFLDPETGVVIDHVGGRRDLEARRLRTVGDAEARFEEDRLRMLRAVRFAARFELAVDPAVGSAARACAAGIRDVARERITEELTRIACGPHPGRALALLEEFGLRAQVLAPVDAGPARQALLGRLPSPRTTALGFAGWLHGLPAAAAARTLDALRLARSDRAGIERVLAVADGVARWVAADLAVCKRLARDPAFPDGLALAAAVAREEPAGAHAVAAARAAAAAWGREDLWPPSYLDGHELRRLGVAPGPAMGRCLRELEDEALRGRLGSAGAARDRVRAWLEAGGAEAE